MRIHTLSCLVVLLSISRGFGQFDSTAFQFSQMIRGASMRPHVEMLASREFEGRETGTTGNQKAADYIAAQFAHAGIPPLPGTDTYFQTLDFSINKWTSNRLMIRKERAEHLKEYLAIPQFFPAEVEKIGLTEMVFLGYGIDDPKYSDYKGHDVKGKHLLVYAGEPRTKDEMFRISGNRTTSEWSTDVMKKVRAAYHAGAASVWIIEDKFADKSMEARRTHLSGQTLMGSPESISKDLVPHFILSTTLAQQLLGSSVNQIISSRDRITKKGNLKPVTFPVSIEWSGTRDVKRTKGVNVLGYIEGVDETMKHEVVIITAHYDHLGKRGDDIFYGADDNGSGTSAVIEIAKAMQAAKEKGVGPKRSVLCMLVTGEEKGLLGSEYYVEHPVFPLENSVANINIDMIGRKDGQHADSNYTYVIGADRLSTALHHINENANLMYTGLELDYTYNLDSDPNRFYYRSDHYNFAKNGIPAIFYFSGVHEDYHRPGDTPDKIMYDKAATIARLAFHTSWELANRRERIKVDVKGRS